MGTQLGAENTKIFKLIGNRDSEDMVAETVGFEPTRRSPAYTLSRRAPSTTRPRLLIGDLI